MANWSCRKFFPIRPKG